MFLQVAAAAVSQMIFSPAVLIFAKAAFLGPGGKPHQRKNKKKTGRGNKQVKNMKLKYQLINFFKYFLGQNCDIGLRSWTDLLKSFLNPILDGNELF